MREKYQIDKIDSIAWWKQNLCHDLLPSPISHHSLGSATTTHNLTPVKHDHWNVSCLCLSHARPTQNTVNHSHEISTFHRILECIMPRYTHIIHSRQWRKCIYNDSTTAMSKIVSVTTQTALTALPDMLAMSRSWLKTPTTVNLAGTNIVCCLDRLDCQTQTYTTVII